MLGAGTPAEVREFVVLLNAMRAQVKHPVAVILVHHDNKSGQVSGAWGPIPDTLVHVALMGHGRTRLLWEKARWASAIHGTSQNLRWAEGESYELEEREEISEDTIREALLAAIAEHPGVGSWRQIREKLRGNDADKARIRDELLAAGEIVNTAAEGRFNLWMPDDPAAAGAEASTALAPLPGLSLNGDGRGGGAPVLSSIEHRAPSTTPAEGSDIDQHDREAAVDDQDSAP
jgi:hypothetical protein